MVLQSEFKSIHRKFWNRFVRDFSNNIPFSNSFHKRAAWEKSYYDLFWDFQGVHICVRHNLKEKFVAVELYIEENIDLYNKLLDQKKDIETQYGHALEFKATKSNVHEIGKARKIIVTQCFNDIENEKDWKSQIEWIQNHSLKMKTIFDYYGLGQNNLDNVGLLFPEEIIISEAERFTEGAQKLIIVNAYERNNAAREECIRVHGSTCIICGFNFGNIYGENFFGKIHVHHVKPLSEIDETYEVNPIIDLIPVCPNCHLVLHSKLGGTYTVEEVKEFFKTNRDE